MERIMKIIGCGLLVMGCFQGPLYGQKPSDFALTMPGALTLDELKLYILHRNKKFREVDIHDASLGLLKDGRIKQKDIDQATKDDIKKIRQRFDKRGIRTSFTFNEIKAFYPEIKTYNFWGFRIRETNEIITFSEKAKNFKDAKPATFSYQRDEKTNTDVWKATGSILRPTEFYKFKLVPSLTFNRITGGNESESANSLIFRLGLNFGDDGASFIRKYWRVFPSYATDFSFCSDIRAVEIQYEPIYMKESYPVNLDGKYVGVKFRGYLHSEMGKVFDAGNNMEVQPGEKLLRVGPRTELTLKLITHLELEGKFYYMYGFRGSIKNSFFRSGKAILHFVEGGHVNLQAEYINGRAPLTQEETRTWTFGLGFKY